MLGLAMRAGRVAIGTDAVINAIRVKGQRAARLVLISASASEATRNKIRYKCEFYKVRAEEATIESSELGEALGKLYAPAAIAITDDSFAGEILRILREISAGENEYSSFTTQRKEVSNSETGDNYAANASENNSNI